LFDDIARNDNRPARYAQPRFDYLNKSVRPECERIRNLLEQWFEHIPSKVQLEIRSRFRDNDDRQFASTFFELYLHELLLLSGFHIDFHPPIEGETTHPDFLVIRDGKQLFYLEATIAASSDTRAATKARENQVYDTLNRMESPNFFIGLEIYGAPDTPPQGRKIRNFLERQLASLNPDEVTEQLKRGGSRALPSWNWKHEDWRITFFPIPKSTSARAKPGVRPIGLQIPELSWHTPHIGIRNALQDKTTKYGHLDLPYVIAINVLDELDVGDDDIENAFFGEEQCTVTFRDNRLIEHVPGRKPNGLWYGPNGPQNKRVSAILVAVNLYPSSIAKVTPILWHNPWANYIIPRHIWSLPQSIPDFRFVRLNGKRSWELLKLCPSWPKICKDA